MKISCIITDDEPFARKGLANYVEKIDFLLLKGKCEDALQLNNLLSSQKIDLLFLDIQMPQISGLDFLKSLKNKPQVILTTAYEQYALEGYELDVLDYLLKPISFERFMKAAIKAQDYFQKEKTPELDYIFIKSDNRLEKVNLSDILFVESLQNYVSIYTKKGKYISHLTLKGFKESVPNNILIQPHKSYLVALANIEAIDGNRIVIGDHKIPISKYLKEEVLQKVVNSKLLKRD